MTTNETLKDINIGQGQLSGRASGSEQPFLSNRRYELTLKSTFGQVYRGILMCIGFKETIEGGEVYGLFKSLDTGEGLILGPELLAHADDSESMARLRLLESTKERHLRTKLLKQG